MAVKRLIIILTSTIVIKYNWQYNNWFLNNRLVVNNNRYMKGANVIKK